MCIKKGDRNTPAHKPSCCSGGGDAAAGCILLMRRRRNAAASPHKRSDGRGGAALPYHIRGERAERVVTGEIPA
jgi:hypothetical protein